MREGSYLVLLLVVTFSGVARAQVVTASLQGVITDASGATVASVTVTAVNLDTSLTRETVSAEDGTYRFNLLPRGRYEVRASKAGFAPQLVKDVNLIVGETLTVNFTLQVQGQTEQLVVTSTPS